MGDCFLYHAHHYHLSSRTFQPPPSLDYGFSVAEYTVHEIDDDDAVAYCIAHNLPNTLKLNRSAFHKLLNSGVIKPEALTYQTTKEARAKLPKDLGKHL